MSNEDKLNAIIEHLFDMKIDERYKNTSFFYEPLYIKARNFLLLFVTVEKEFGIRFPDEVIKNKKIITYNMLLNTINEMG